jgi:hypothetical protein
MAPAIATGTRAIAPTPRPGIRDRPGGAISGGVCSISVPAAVFDAQVAR